MKKILSLVLATTMLLSLTACGCEHELVMSIYAIFVLLEMIFCFVAFAKMKNTSEKNAIES